jgi:hypothetical protein
MDKGAAGALQSPALAPHRHARASSFWRAVSLDHRHKRTGSASAAGAFLRFEGDGIHSTRNHKKYQGIFLRIFAVFALNSVLFQVLA